MNIKVKRWVKIIGGFGVLLFLGVTLAWSIFVVPIEALYGWTRSQTSLAFTMNTIFFSVGSILTGVLSKRLSFSNILKIAGIVIGIGFLLTSYAQSVILLYITYGVLVGTALGMGYNVVISACPLWMPEKQATATGILLMGYALSTAIFGPVLNNLVANVGIVTTFKILAVVCGVGIFVLGFIVSPPAIEDMQALPQRDRAAGKKTYNVITSDMIKMPLFWVYFIIFVMLPGLGLSIINHNAPMMTETLQTSAAFAASIVSICSLCNGGGRFFFGLIFDKLGVKKSVMICAMGYFSAIVLIFLGLSTNTVFLYVAGACLLFLSHGCNATSIPSIMREMFGHRTFSLNYSVLTIGSVFSAFFPSIIGTIQVSTGSYIMPMVLLIGAGGVNLLIVLVFLKLYNNEMKKRA